MGRRGEQGAALCGLLYPVLLIGGDDVVARVAGEAPYREPSTAKVVAWATESDTTRFFVGRTIGLIGVLLLVLFVSHVATRMRLGDRGGAADAVLSFGILVVACELLSSVAQLTAVRWADDGLDPKVVSALNDLSGSFVLSMLPMGLLLILIGAKGRDGELMASWIGWLGVGVGLALVAGSFVQSVENDAVVGAAFLPTILAWFVWFPAASISLLRRSAR